MTEIYLHFLFAHYGLYGNAPVICAGLLHATTCRHRVAALPLPLFGLEHYDQRLRWPQLANMPNRAELCHPYRLTPEEELRPGFYPIDLPPPVSGKYTLDEKSKSGYWWPCPYLRRRFRCLRGTE